jgi:hypothetical protein
MAAAGDATSTDRISNRRINSAMTHPRKNFKRRSATYYNRKHPCPSEREKIKSFLLLFFKKEESFFFFEKRSKKLLLFNAVLQRATLLPAR